MSDTPNQSCPILPIIQVSGRSFDLHSALERAVEADDLDDFRMLLRRMPNELQNQFIYSHLLQLVMSRDAPNTEVAMYMLSICSFAATQADDLGNLLLHYAVMRRNHISKNLITALLQIDRNSAGAPNHYGETPLHLLLEQDRPDCDVVRLFLWHCPECARRATNSGKLPIHILLNYNRYSPSIEAFHLVFKAYLPAVIEETEDEVTQITFDTTQPRRRLKILWTPLLRARDRNFIEINNIINGELFRFGKYWTTSHQYESRPHSI